jgi:hypothetical protein
MQCHSTSQFTAEEERAAKTLHVSQSGSIHMTQFSKANTLKNISNVSLHWCSNTKYMGRVSDQIMQSLTSSQFVTDPVWQVVEAHSSRSSSDTI